MQKADYFIFLNFLQLRPLTANTSIVSPLCKVHNSFEGIELS